MATTTAERPHGYARYKLHGCRCYTCAWAVSEYNRQRQQAIAAGTWRHDATPVRIHVRSLMATGMGYKRVAAVAGLNISTVSRLLYGRKDLGLAPPATTRHDLAVKLLAVEPDLHPGAHIEATGTARRAQALVAIGHTLTAIAGEVGWTLQNFSRIVNAGSTPYACRVEVRTAQAVARLYDRWSMTAPVGLSADKARRHAHRRGWFPPLAWDDDTIDDPTATPCVAPPVDDSDPCADELALQHAAAGHEVTVDPVTRVELVRRLTAAGYPTEQVAAIARTSVAMVGYTRSRYGIHVQRAAA